MSYHKHGMFTPRKRQACMNKDTYSRRHFSDFQALALEVFLLLLLNHSGMFVCGIKVLFCGCMKEYVILIT